MPTRLALDTNLLVLFVVGQVSRGLIAKHRRSRAYSETDFELLTKVLSGFERLLVTPNSTTETSNLIVQGVFDPLRSHLLAVLAQILSECNEHYEPSATVCEAPEYLRLGLTDAAWLKALDDRSVLLTADGALFAAAQQRGIEAYDFANVRRFRALN